MTTHICGVALALLGFGSTLIIGLYVGNPFTTVILRGLAVMVLFYLLGGLLSALGQKAVMENFQNHVDAVRAQKLQAQQQQNEHHEPTPPPSPNNHTPQPRAEPSVGAPV